MEEVSTLCHHCGITSLFKLRGKCDAISSADIYVEDDPLEKTVYKRSTWNLLQCTICSYPILEEEASLFIRTFIVEPDGDVSEDDELITRPSTEIVYPVVQMDLTPPPVENMPNAVMEVYNEARTTFAVSSRSSAALLRLALQELCIHLGQPGKNINTDIANLVKEGLPKRIQQAADIIRIVGNNAVHPGEIDLRENKETVLKLFDVINLIVTEMITHPQKIEKIYNTLPENDRKWIANRDKRARDKQMR